MPTNWDELLNWGNIGFKPKYEEPQRVETDFFGGMGNRVEQPMPQYDMNPMQRYKSYLDTEPTREDYRPGKFRNVINSLSAGFEGMESGSLGRAAQLYDALNDRGYDQAYEGWKNRGNKVKADVDLENTRYRNATTDYDRMRDNERQNRSVDIQGQNANTALQRLDIERQRLSQAGWDLRDGPDGKQIRVKLATGEMEPTDLPNRSLTAEEQKKQFEIREGNAMTRHNTATGSAVLGARTATRNTDARIGAQASEGQKNRDADWSRWTTRSASVNDPKTTVATPTNTRTLPDLIKNGYPEFDRKDFIQFDPATGQLAIEVDDKKVATKLREIAGADDAKFVDLVKRWKDFKTTAARFPTRRSQ